MQLKIYKDHQGLSDAAANEVIDLVKSKPNAVICMASGETPRLTCKLVVEKAVKLSLFFSDRDFQTIAIRFITGSSIRCLIHPPG